MGVLNISNFEKEADNILSNARQEAERIIKAANDSAETLKQSLVEKSVIEAQKKIDQIIADKVAKIREELEPRFQTQNNELIGTLCEQIKISVSKETELISSKVIEIAFAIAGRIVSKEFRLNPEIMVNTLKESMSYTAVSKVYRIHVNPEMVSIVKSFTDSVKGDPFLSGAKFEIIRDDSISPGGCRIESDSSTIDATVERQLERLGDFLR